MGKKLTVLFFILSLVGFGAGYVLTNPVDYGFCSQTEYSCRDLYNHIGDALVYGMRALALIFLVLLFIPRAFSAWKKFAIWFVPLAALLFAFYPEPGGGFFNVDPYPEQVFQWVSALYVLVSLVIIVVASMRQSRSGVRQ